MHYHVRIHHWVMWWFYVGIVCGIVALVNIMGRDLSAEQIKVVLIIGALFWLLGGIACYGYGGVKIVLPPQPSRTTIKPRKSPQTEWHSASDFVLPGNRKSILPPRY